ncbi:MAG: hybrid sensor histidine kinase/response regulator [Ramlibacter sp.]|jgi:signal transduction histidine kinase/DNA-binding LytR/AlgR family response regulator|nr:hybrid sensor histidine kinase/response regulator [Ramlibacter sp.]
MGAAAKEGLVAMDERESGAGFIEAHRQKIFLGLSVAGTLLLGPFAVNNFVQGRLLLGVITSAFVACLLANAVSIGRGRPPVVPGTAIFAGSLAGLATAMYDIGLVGILWVYPGILLFHFMLPRRQANLFNVTLVLVTIPMAWMHLGPQVTARVAVTLSLLVVFANIYSYIADAQQAKEAEQRERLDALVRQLEAQNTALREAFRLREEVERIARHDLKTPLASIASVPRLLRERRRFDAAEDELLGMVEGAAQRVLSMVNLSLDLFRMEEGTYRLRAQAVDLKAIVQTVASELHAHARSKQLRLVLDLPPGPVHAQGEELLCYSTLANLMKNALEASPDAGEVRVTLRRVSDGDGDAVALDIHNEGQVPPELRDRFFEKYATHGKAGGTGLGAYSARMMARVQRGSLRMKSGEQGTTLSLRLPLWHATAPVRPTPGPIALREPVRAEALPPLSVLVADDDEYNIVVLKSLLPSPPLSVRMAVNGRAALESVRRAHPDIVFMDVEMPVMGGIEAVRGIRALQAERGESPSFIAAFSAHDDEGTREACLAAGFDVYLAKPASREEVVAVLRRQDPATVGHRESGGGGAVLIEPGLMSTMPQFLDSRRALAQELAAAAEHGEREIVRATAHKLAGSLAMYGFRDASRASHDLEHAAATENLEQLRARCAALESMIAQVQPQARPLA